MKKKEVLQKFKDCAKVLSFINTRNMPKVVKAQLEAELQELCMNITRQTMDIYRRYDNEEVCSQG